ncbi:MFS transporter [Bacillaceae bacterium Marseille-Q3522]|nr:MFS transporter [Bacillaceae bacterium Marseille-Q3522]
MISSFVKNRTFLLLVGGKSISIFGDRIYSIALMWYIIEKTGSTLSLGMSVICMTLPSVLAMPWAGVLADKNIKKELLIVSDTARGIMMFAIVLLTMNGNTPFFAINICLIMVSAMDAFFSPALSATIPLVIEKDKLSRANAILQFVQQLSNIVGPAIGGILVAFMSIPMLFALNGLSFFISAVFSLFLRIPSVKVTDDMEPFFTRFIGGVRYTMQMKRVLFLIIVGGVIINFFLAPLNVFLVLICNQVINAGSTGLGWIEASISAGAFLGSFIIFSNIIKNQIRLAVIGLTLEGIALILASLFMNLTSLIIFFSLLGIGVCFASVGISTVYQLMIEKEKMGRVMSFNSMLCTCTVPLGIFVGSIIIKQFSVTNIILIYGLIVALSGISLIIPFKEKLVKSGLHD